MKKSALTVKNSMYKEEHLQRIQRLRLMDDDFMTKMFEGHTECVQLVLRIILDKPDLEVIDSKTQVFGENLTNRSVRFDIIASDSKGNRYNIEIQRTDKGAGRKRARYNSSMLDQHSLEKGEVFEQLPETYVIFITERDVLKYGYSVYFIERQILGTEELFNDGAHILYVNGEYRDDTPIGRLMHDFSCENPDDMNYQLLAERARYFKESEEGREIMCRAFEELIEQGAMNKTIELVKRMMVKNQMSLEEVLDTISATENERQYILDNIDR